MKRARSIAYQRLIEAEEPGLNEKSYLRMKLICPHCKCPVFFRRGSGRTEHSRTYYNPDGTVKRTSRVRSAEIGDHFAHFGGGGESCARHVNAYTPKKIARENALGRGQRIKIFQASFWRILRTSHLLAGWEEDALLFQRGFVLNFKDSPIDGESYYEKFIDSMVAHIRGKRKDIGEMIARIAERIPKLDPTRLDPITREALRELRLDSPFEVQQQIEIASESLDYLLGDRRHPMLRDIVKASCIVLCDRRSATTRKFFINPLIANPSEDDLVLNENEDLLLDIGQELLDQSVESDLAPKRIVTFAHNCKRTLSLALKLSLPSLVPLLEMRLASILSTIPFAQAFEADNSNQLELPRINLSRGLWFQHLNNDETHYLAPFWFDGDDMKLLETEIEKSVRDRSFFFPIPHYPNLVCCFSMDEFNLTFKILTKKGYSEGLTDKSVNVVEVISLGCIAFDPDGIRRYWEKTMPALRSFYLSYLNESEWDEDIKGDVLRLKHFLTESIDSLNRRKLPHFPLLFLTMVNLNLQVDLEIARDLGKAIGYCLYLSALSAKNESFAVIPEIIKK